MRGLTAQLARHLVAPRTDGELLAGFLTCAAESESDFAELVRRHSPLVWGVCRRSLPDPADAEDAFQAVFLVLVRRAGRLTSYPTVGPWLHRVAAWTARNVRRRNARRMAKRVALSDQLPATPTDPDLSLDLDAALLALPEKYRSPVVLCHLLGFTRTEAAARLGCPEGTLSAWLSRGLAKLRARLGGLDPAKALGVAAVAVPGALSASVVRAAVASQVSVAATSTVSQIVEGVLHMFWVKKATAASVALFAVFALGMGVGMSTRQGVGTAEAQAKTGGAPPVKVATAAPAIDDEIAKLEAQLRAAEAGLHASRQGVKLTEEKIALDKGKGLVTEAERLNDLITLARFKENEAQAAKMVLDVKQRLDALKAARVRAVDAKQPPAKTPPATVKEIEGQLQENTAQLVELQKKITDRREQQDNAAREILKLERQVEAVREAYAELAKKRDTLAKKPAEKLANAGPYLELTLHGKDRRFEFSLRETDEKGSDIGTVIVREPEMLTKLLTRVRNDATAPRELRVTIDPTASLTGHTVAALRACNAAGYKTVRVTGYVFRGGEATLLEPDQKGEVAGYRRYEGVGKSPADLIKEIEEGLSRL